MFTDQQIAEVATHAMNVVKALDGLTVGDALIVLKQAESVINGVQRIDAGRIEHSEAMQAVMVGLGFA